MVQIHEIPARLGKRFSKGSVCATLVHQCDYECQCRPAFHTRFSRSTTVYVWPLILVYSGTLHSGPRLMAKIRRKLDNYAYTTVRAPVSSSTSALAQHDGDYLPPSKAKSVSFLLADTYESSRHPTSRTFFQDHQQPAEYYTHHSTSPFDAGSTATFPRQGARLGPPNQQSYFRSPQHECVQCGSNIVEANKNYSSLLQGESSSYPCRQYRQFTRRISSPEGHNLRYHNVEPDMMDLRINATPVFLRTDSDGSMNYSLHRHAAEETDVDSSHGADIRPHTAHVVTKRPPSRGNVSCQLVEPLSVGNHLEDGGQVPPNVYYIKAAPCESSAACECTCDCSCPSSSSHFHELIDCTDAALPAYEENNHQRVCGYHEQTSLPSIGGTASDEGVLTTTASEVFYQTSSLSLDGRRHTPFMICIQILLPCVFLHRIKEREISESPPLPAPPPPPPLSSSQEALSTRFPPSPFKSKSIERIDERSRKPPIRYSVISYPSSSSSSSSSSSTVIDRRCCSKLPRRTVFVFILCIAAVFGLTTKNMFNVDDYEERVRFIHTLLNETILVDGHNDLPWNIRMYKHNLLNRYNYDQNLKSVHPWSTSNWSHTDLPRLRSGRIGAQMWSAYTHCESQFKDAVQMALEQIDLIKRFTRMYGNMFNLCLSYNDIVETGKERKVCSIITLEGGHNVANSLAVLRMYYDLGVRSMALTNKDCSTPWAESASSERKVGNKTFPVIGLNKFGLTVVNELNRLGMVIDLSGTSASTMKDALNASKAPVVFSHSNARGVCNVTQNVPDDILRLVVQNNGVVMVTFYPSYLSCKNEANISHVVEHINYLKQVAGVDHIGIGSGFDGIDRVPYNLNDTSYFPELFTELAAPGNPEWKPDELKKLAGLNILRVFREVEKVRDSMKNLSPHEDVFKRFNNKTTGRRYDREMRVCISHNHILN